MYHFKKDFVQKYIQKYIKEIDVINYNTRQFYYEVTVTFNPSYWSLNQAMVSIPQIVADVLKPIVKEKQLDKIILAYVVEYHENGYPHLHAQVITQSSIDPENQRNIHQRLCRRYGKSQWYQTGEEDMVHINNKFPDGIKWSEYIKKDKCKNEENGMKHYFQYQLGF